MISQGFSGSEVKFSIAIGTNDADALEKGASLELGEEGSLSHVTQSSGSQQPRFHLENVVGLLPER